MATLFNTKIKDTYQSLLKLEDNTILTTTVKNITDGLGNASPLYMSTTRIGIGTNAPTTTLDVNGSVRLQNTLELLGNTTYTGNDYQFFFSSGSRIRFQSGGSSFYSGIGGAAMIVLRTSTTGAVAGTEFTGNNAPNTSSTIFKFNNAFSGNLGVSTTHNFIELNPTGTVGQGSPTLRTLYINPSITGFTSHIAFENTTGNVILGSTSGNVMIGTTTDAGYKLDVNGTVRTGNLTIGTMLIGDVGGSRVFNTAGLAIDYGTVYPFSITGSGDTSITPAGILTLKGVTHNYTATETYRVQKTTNIGHMQINFDIAGSDASSFNYGTRSGNVRIYPGEQSNGNGYGNVILGHSGTSARGNVGIGTITPTAVLDVATPVTASSALARAVNISNTLTAAANNDSLVSLDINPTFTNGAFTGVNNYNIRTRGLLNKMYFQSPTTNQGRHDISFGFGGNGEQVKLIATAMGGSGEGNLYISLASGDVAVATTANANALFQTGGNVFYKGFSLEQSALTSGNGLYLSGNQQNVITNGIYFRFGETRVAILSKPNGGSGYADFRIAIVPLGSGSPNNPPQLSDTKFMITQDTTNVLIGTTTDAGFKLDVNGTIRSTGVMYIGNSSITGNFGAMVLSNSGTAGVSLSFTNSRWGSDNPCVLGDQGAHAHSSAQVEIRSSAKGFLPPRMTSTQRNAIATPATGLQVFDTTQNAICEYTGTAWRTVSGGKQVINATTGATTLDLSLGNVADVTLTLSTVLTLNNPTVGTYVIKLIQDAIGGKTVSWPFNVLWSGSTPPTLTATANRTDVITLLYDGVNFYGTYALNF